MNNVNIVMIETNKIKPYLRNARFNEETVQKLVEIIPKVGFNQPIVIDKENVIVKGHSRWKAAIKLGIDKVPCIISQNSDEVNKLDRLADNKIQEFSKWDNSILSTELASINIDDIDLNDFGFDLSSLNEIPKLNTEWDLDVEIPTYSENTNYSQPNNNNVNPTTVYPKQEEITEKDIMKTVATNNAEYGHLTCPNCGQVCLYKKG